MPDDEGAVDEKAVTETFSIGELSMVIQKFSDMENKRFDAAWENMVVERHQNRDIRLFDEIDKELVRKFAQAFKNDTDGLTFMGLNVKSGFGIRPIMPEDIMSRATAAGTNTTAAKRWEVTMTTQADTGNSDRNWCSSAAPDNATFAACTEVRLTDSSGADHWALVILGIRDFAISPVIKSVIWKQNTIPSVRAYVEELLKNSDLGIARFGPIWVKYKQGQIATGLEVRGTAATETVTIDAKPLGFAFITSQRSLNISPPGPIAVS